MSDFVYGGWNPSLEMIEASRDFVIKEVVENGFR